MPDLFVPEKETATAPAPTKTQQASSPDESHIHAFSSFCVDPVGTSFETQEDGEQILLFLRSHFITNVPWIITAVFFIVFPLIIQQILTFNPFLLPMFAFISPSFLFILLGIYYLLIFSFVFISFITWFYNIGLITNIRVIDIDFSDLVYHDVAVTKLNIIEDVRYTQTGFVRSLFNYGDVFVETAGNTDDFDFLAVPKPAQVVNIIQNLIGGRR
jgi:hypothetical protein